MSSYYENNASWSAPGRQPSWEQQAPPSRSGTASASRDESAAFSSQFEAIAALQSMFLSRPQASARDRKTDMAYAEIDRATDNLVKSGKWMGGLTGPNRRESMPQMMGRPYGAEYDPRGSGPARHHSVSEYDGMRSSSAGGLQGYYANQRFAPQQQQQQQQHQQQQQQQQQAAQQAQQAAQQQQQQQQQAAAAAAQQPPRANEAEQMMQAKRRMAAQRERELRNYHQEQQYNRNITGVTKPDRSSSMSPNTGMSEDERRELIARQHRALYGNESNLYNPDGSAATAQRRQSQDVRVGSSISGPSGASARGASPLAFEPFGNQVPSGAAGESAVQMPPRDQPKSPNSGSSPSSNHTSSFGLIDNVQSSRTSVSSPTGSPPLGQAGKQSIATAAGVVPIGTRPAQPAAVSSLNKRATTPLPSPLSYGFNANEQQPKADSSASTTSNAAENPISGLGASWASNSSGWGASKNSLGVQASVWG